MRTLVRSQARRFTVFGLIGIAVFLVSEGLLALELSLGMNAFWAYLVQAIISVEISFLANWVWVFERRTPWRSSLWKFNLSRGATIPLNQLMFVGLLWAGTHVGLSVPATSLIANVLLVAFFTIVNYLAAWLWAFRQPSLSAMRPDESKAVTPSAGNLPPVAVVVPVKDGATTVRGCVTSLLAQNHQPAVIVVGDPGDAAWCELSDYIAAGRVSALEADVHSVARDANAKRNIGLDYAISSGYDTLALTDCDMVLPPDWTQKGASLIQAGWQCAAGPMHSVETGFWPDYIDKNPILPKTPRMSSDYVVTAANFGRVKPPITANVFLTATAYEAVGGLDPDFVRDYEDYEFFARMTALGIDILCSDYLAGDHHHRSGLRMLARDYEATGWGCADFVTRRPTSPFAAKRLHQIAMLRMAGLVGPTSVAALLAWLPSAWLAVMTTGLAGYSLIAAYAVLQTRTVKAALFPLITGFFLVAFMRGFNKGRAFNKTGPPSTWVAAVSRLPSSRTFPKECQ